LTSVQPVPLHVTAARSASTPLEVTDVNVSKVSFALADATKSVSQQSNLNIMNNASLNFTV
jgi:hypothetical protein